MEVSSMHKFNTHRICSFVQYLQDKERSPATIQKYRRCLEQFFLWLPKEKTVSKANVVQYKNHLMESHAPGGVNTILAALNGFFRFMNWNDCIVKPLHIQRRLFSDQKRELHREEYIRLVETARLRNNTQLELILQLMASTGMRVSEISYVTAEALECNRIQIHLKGKIRTILLPGKLCHKLRKFQRRQNIQSGPIFLSKQGKPVDRRWIWAQMKQLCAAAGVEKTKVFPHNLRHLFARTFYKAQKDIAKLADVLGHSSIETTRIYLLSSGMEHQKILDSLHLIC